MNVSSIKQYLANDYSNIIKLLEQSNFYHLSFNHFKNEVRCANYPDGNPTAVRINCETLGCISFSTDIKGDIIGLIQKHNEWDYLYTLNHIQEVLGICFDEKYKHTSLFGGFYKNINRVYNHDNIKENNYSIDILKGFIDHPNAKFYNDNISLESQYKFHVGFDPVTNRITVPWFDINGKLVGITGRYNFKECGENPKWKAIYNFSKGNYLYGLYENYKSIKEQGYVIIR